MYYKLRKVIIELKKPRNYMWNHFIHFYQTSVRYQFHFETCVGGVQFLFSIVTFQFSRVITLSYATAISMVTITVISKINRVYLNRD